MRLQNNMCFLDLINPQLQRIHTISEEIEQTTSAEMNRKQKVCKAVND